MTRLLTLGVSAAALAVLAIGWSGAASDPGGPSFAANVSKIDDHRCMRTASRSGAWS
jgi:hypothetical protein